MVGILVGNGVKVNVGVSVEVLVGNGVSVVVGVGVSVGRGVAVGVVLAVGVGLAAAAVRAAWVSASSAGLGPMSWQPVMDNSNKNRMETRSGFIILSFVGITHLLFSCVHRLLINLQLIL